MNLSEKEAFKKKVAFYKLFQYGNFVSLAVILLWKYKKRAENFFETLKLILMRWQKPKSRIKFDWILTSFTPIVPYAFD